MRGPAIKLPGNEDTKWNDLNVCGVVYAEAISDLCTQLTALASGDKGGWITEYKKARAAIYYTLTDEERESVADLCEAWNRGTIPKPVKKKYV